MKLRGVRALGKPKRAGQDSSTFICVANEGTILVQKGEMRRQVTNTGRDCGGFGLRLELDPPPSDLDVKYEF